MKQFTIALLALFALSFIACSGGDSEVTIEVSFVESESRGAESATHGIDLRVTTIPSGATLLENVTVSVTTAGSASEGDDFSFGGSTITFLAGSVDGLRVPIEVVGVADSIVEGDETVLMSLAGLSKNVALGEPSTHTLTLVDDALPSVSFLQSSSTVGEQAGAHSIEVRLTVPEGNALLVPLSVQVADTSNGDALSGTDYVALATTTLEFPVGATDGAILSVSVTPRASDDLVEGDEYIELVLQGLAGVGGVSAPMTHTLTITDNDTATVSFVDSDSATTDEASALPVDAVLSTVPVTATLAIAVAAEIVDLGIGTATSGSDYSAIDTQTLNFSAGAGNGAVESFTVVPIFDDDVEGAETIVFALQNASVPASLGTGDSHELTIVDDDVATLAFAQATSSSVDEASAPSVLVELSIAGGGVLAVPVTVVAGDAGGGSATSDTDYSLSTQTLTFAVGAGTGMTQAVVLGVIDDNDVEGDETVNLLLQEPSSLAALGTQTSHQSTIADDDVATLAFESASSATVDEVTALGINVELSIAGGGVLAIAISVAVVDSGMGSATSGADYSAFGTQVASFGIGAGNGTTQAVTLTPLDELAVEIDETVQLTLQASVGPAAIGGQNTHQVSITNDDFNQAPTATDDTYETVGNTRLHATSNVPSLAAPIRNPVSLLDNDTDPDAGDVAQLACTPIVAGATSEGGSVELAGNCEFVYTPPAGVTGVTDSFSYTLVDPGALSDTGIVSIDVVDLVWYVDESAADGGDGRDNSRFNTLASVPTNSDGSAVYVFEGNTPGALTMSSDQRLIGAGVALELNVNNQLTDPDVLFVASARPELTESLALASGNTLRGFNSSDISGSSVGALVVSDVSVSSTGAAAVNIENGVGVDAQFDSVSFDGSVRGIRLRNNTGAFTFSTVAITTTSFAGVFATSTGQLTIGGGTIDAGAARAVSIGNTALDITLTSIRSVGGTLPALNLESTTGSFTVTGDGNTAGSGGTIASKTGSDAAFATDGVGVRLIDAEGVSLSFMTFFDFQNWAILGTQVNGFALRNSSVGVSAFSQNGTNPAFDEGSIFLAELTGNVFFTDDTIADGLEDNLRVVNTTGTLDSLTVENSVVGTNSLAFGRHGISVEASGTALVTANIRDNTFSGAREAMVFSQTEDTATSNIIVQDNAFTNSHGNTMADGGGAVRIVGGGTGSNIVVNYDISGTTPGAQTIRGSGGAGATIRGDAIRATFSTGTGTISGTIRNNSIGVSGVALSGTNGGAAIRIANDSSHLHSTNIASNVIREVASDLAAIEIAANSNVATNTKLIDNNVALSNSAGSFALAAVYISLGGVGTETGTACSEIDGNVFDASAAPFTGSAIFLDQVSNLGEHNLPGYSGSGNGEFAFACAPGTASSGLATYLAGRGNLLVDGAFPIVSGVDATIACGITGVGSTCP